MSGIRRNCVTYDNCTNYQLITPGLDMILATVWVVKETQTHKTYIQPKELFMDYPMIQICYRVMDLDASEKFYQDAFGFEVSRKKDYPENKFTLSYLTAAGLPFELEYLFYN